MNVESRLRVAVLSGGRSAEHEVSLASGRAARDGLQAAGHEVLWVQIERDGSWRHEGRRLSVCPGAGLLGVDVAFAALHGPFGEDGTMQGMLESLDVPYVGAGVAASAVCMDKILFKRLMGAAGVEQVAYVGIRAPRWLASRAGVLAEVAALGLPVFVKPARQGSSVGIAKVSAAGELEAAIEAGFAHDAQVIVEAQAVGVEVECGVLGLPDTAAATPPEQRSAEVGSGAPASAAAGASAPLDVPATALASEPGEIVFAGDWYDYGAKYTQGGMEVKIPARIGAGARTRVMELAVQTFEYAGCAGLARVDFFVDGERVLVNELNTMPGFTPTSVYAKLMGASGVPYPELVDRLCRLAIERHASLTETA
ncbi:MAG: D-alanine--D-alanine ligase family protein [Solirubrobacteraceae bacterium]